MIFDEKPLQDLIIEAIAAGDLQLPVFSSVALRLQQALHNKDIGIAEIEAMIVEDQALASQILRVANTAFFKGLQKITTIRKAILRLGIQQVANLAMAVSQQTTYSTNNKILNQYMDKLWQHAFASALGSKWVAERSGYRSEADAAFLAGLLHNIGQLLILKVLEAVCTKHTIDLNLPDAFIVEMLNSDMHTEQGYLLMKQWNLPEEYCVVARDHHQEFCDKHNILLVIARLADQVCDKTGIGLHCDPNSVLATSLEAQFLALTEVQLAELEILLEDSINIQIAP